MADASFHKTFMATNVVNLSCIGTEINLFSPLDRCSTLAVATDLLLLGVFCFLGFSFFHYRIIFSYVTETKTSQWVSVHWAVFSALSHADVRSCSQHNQEWTKEGLPQCDVPKKTDKGLFALVYMQCIPPMAICYLIVAVSKCMWLKQ